MLSRECRVDAVLVEPGGEAKGVGLAGGVGHGPRPSSGVWALAATVERTTPVTKGVTGVAYSSIWSQF